MSGTMTILPPSLKPVASTGLPHPREPPRSMGSPRESEILEAISPRVRGRSIAALAASMSLSTNAFGIPARANHRDVRPTCRVLDPRTKIAKSSEGTRWTVPRMHHTLARERVRQRARSTSSIVRPRTRARRASWAATMTWAWTPQVSAAARVTWVLGKGRSRWCLAMRNAWIWDQVTEGPAPALDLRTIVEEELARPEINSLKG